MKFNRDKYFDSVRHSLFSGTLNQGQVDGQNAILLAWQAYAPDNADLRWLAYCLATTYHETSKEMLPIEEYGKGEGQPYGVLDPETEQTYYGRGFVQLTWRDNYERATQELNLSDLNDLEWHADRALNPPIAARVMFAGMTEGWFRKDDKGPHTLERYFNDEDDDAFGAREIINGDKTKVPSWSGGKNIGTLISEYHESFLIALENSLMVEPVPEVKVVVMRVTVPAGVRVDVTVDEA